MRRVRELLPLPRRRRLLGLVAAMPAIACATSGFGEKAALRNSDESEPRPAGVAMDPPLSLPSAVASSTTESGVAVLSPPVDPSPARRVVALFFEAVALESDDMLSRLLLPSATTVAAARRPEPALAAWRRRFSRFDYTTLAAERPFLVGSMELRTAQDMRTETTTRGLPFVPHDQEILARAPLQGPSIGRLLAPEMLFLLSPGADGYKIRQVFDDFRIP
jgi:hypothetical protein